MYCKQSKYNLSGSIKMPESTTTQSYSFTRKACLEDFFDDVVDKKINIIKIIHIMMQTLLLKTNKNLAIKRG